MRSNGWTPERRAKQRQAIHAWRPWERATGPRTSAGKGAVAKNAWKHGQRSAAAQQEATLLRKFISSIPYGAD